MTRRIKEKNQLPYLIFLILALAGCGYIAYYFVSFYITDAKPYDTTLTPIESQIEQLDIIPDIFQIENIVVESDSIILLPDPPLPTPNSQLPTPDLPLPTPDPPLPTPNSQLPTPNSPLPTPDSPLPTQNLPNNRMQIINPSLPEICIIVTDFGNITSGLFEKFNALDRNVAFAFIPEQKNTQAQIDRAIKNNRTVFTQTKINDPKSNKELEIILKNINDDIISLNLDLYLDVPDSSIKNAKTRIKYIQQLTNKDIVIVATSGTSEVKYRQLKNFIDGLKNVGYQIVPI